MKYFLLGGKNAKKRKGIWKWRFKKKVTVQLRVYDSSGTYEEKSEDESSSIQIKNATEEEVRAVIENALEKNLDQKKTNKKYII